MKRFIAFLVAFVFHAGPSPGQSPLPSPEEVFPKDESVFQWIENLGDYPLVLQSPHRWILLSYEGTIECEYYGIDTRAPGLISSNDSFFNFRDTNLIRVWIGDHLFFLMDEQDDRGFNPSDTDFHSEFQQYFLRYTPFTESWVNVQLGKFATPVGNFVPRHESFENPLVRHPMPYDYLTVLDDGQSVPNKAALLARRDQPDKKGRWIPMIWGPAYHTGAEVFGTVDRFEYALAVANAALSSRPNQWDMDLSNDDSINYSGRVGWNPTLAWRLGVSYARGPYLKESAVRPVPNAHIDDFNQETWGFDANYSVGHWQFWGEFFTSSWEVPNLNGKLRAYSYYLESRYQFTPRLYGAVRWGQMLFDGDWDRDAWRAEIGLGYYFARNLLGKIEYEHNDQGGRIQQGANMVSMQLALKL